MANKPSSDAPKRSNVTTKRGDRGDTNTISGERYSKSHLIIECCGKLDTLRAETALCRLMLMESGREDADDLAEFLLWILHVYFLVGAQCNDPLNKKPEHRREDVSPRHVERLEEFQADLEARAPVGRVFIASASNRLAAHIDLACTAARAFERDVVRLREQYPAFEGDAILTFTNRLSDSLFVLARFVEDGNHTPLDYERFKE